MQLYKTQLLILPISYKNFFTLPIIKIMFNIILDILLSKKHLIET